MTVNETDQPSWARKCQSEMSTRIAESLTSAVSPLSEKIGGL